MEAAVDTVEAAEVMVVVEVDTGEEEDIEVDTTLTMVVVGGTTEEVAGDMEEAEGTTTTIITMVVAEDMEEVDTMARGTTSG